MLKHVFHTKIKIETLQKHLSCDNLWVLEYKQWKEVWASVSVKYVSSKGALYLFEVRWCGDFPQEFRVIMNGAVFVPIQSPIIEPGRGSILFHTKVNQSL